eukprot:TRINITY_DN1471_c0_g1_i1.p1 TRINITY_DN1471_c0_g1~~TRINITY_DN1471_c0_g1_i1.p1  ORF type:complete len:286 (+),score=85.41 TRINITY_DN1471_c0_g1_i1:50-859(+)
MFRPAAPVTVAAGTATLWYLGGTGAFVSSPAPRSSAPEAAGNALRGSVMLSASGCDAVTGRVASGMMAAAAVAGAGRLAARRPTAPRKAAAAAAEVPAAKEEVEPPFDPKKEPGVTLPLMYFDPAGFAKMGDREGFYQLRSAELKHGRVAMIASLGLVGQHFIKFPGFEDVPSGIQAAITPPGTFGLLAIVALGGALESTIFKQDPDMDPGDFGDPAGFGQTYTEWKDRELNNCRMGMISFLGIVAAELATGKDGFDQIWTPLGSLSAE